MKKQLIKKHSNMGVKAPNLSLAHRALLSQSVASLTPPIAEAGFEKFFEKLDRELADRNLDHVKIIKYFGDEWFCPDRSTAIAIPFWLANKSLRAIERKLIGFVEGGTDEEFMRLLRHEAGHCMDHAFRLSRREEWQRYFGNPRQKYDPDHVVTRPGHPDFVVNLEDGYAQTHPEEDFAETFAVWLDPESDWDNVYRHQKNALSKLKYVDQLMTICSKEMPRKLDQTMSYNARRMRRSLEAYYRDRKMLMN